MNVTEGHRRDNIRSFLKTLRLRLDPQTPVLGEFERLDIRKGRRVSQEEVAEAVGVSRGWYVSLESGAPIQPSVRLLYRLAGVLNASPRERAMLFSIVIPELGSLLTVAVE
jgi:DNA-binding XRE family transcriptional regulator